MTALNLLEIFDPFRKINPGKTIANKALPAQDFAAFALQKIKDMPVEYPDQDRKDWETFVQDNTIISRFEQKTATTPSEALTILCTQYASAVTKTGNKNQSWGALGKQSAPKFLPIIIDYLQEKQGLSDRQIKSFVNHLHDVDYFYQQSATTPPAEKSAATPS